eukprot:CAMPEP_0197837300 /NCGR_PEP_ID=MMETSP1437-20131217/31740_1 /TAXON_ID=49252 ORGANISM="Eucampia antarctica, Strain CCMP1452" /NCGR_SAMPLE_ID=MMETSP1437 /ASSEMBLY_ACC=CAM_ASM_001096 /LENGTH=107 /DNA_ID=CAMNT_0043444237 /DNA_START=1 /DNA_END=324 /DNA_ORIENTATION=-
MRAIQDDAGFIGDDIIVDAATDLIRHQQLHGIDIGYSFENPALNKFWHYIECIALGVRLKKKVADETQMDAETILNAAQSQIDTFKVFLPDDDDDEPSYTKKRKKGN